MRHFEGIHGKLDRMEGKIDRILEIAKPRDTGPVIRLDAPPVNSTTSRQDYVESIRGQVLLPSGVAIRRIRVSETTRPASLPAESCGTEDVGDKDGEDGVAVARAFDMPEKGYKAAKKVFYQEAD